MYIFASYSTSFYYFHIFPYRIIWAKSIRTYLHGGNGNSKSLTLNSSLIGDSARFLRSPDTITQHRIAPRPPSLCHHIPPSIRQGISFLLSRVVHTYLPWIFCFWVKTWKNNSFESSLLLVYRLPCSRHPIASDVPPSSFHCRICSGWDNGGSPRGVLGVLKNSINCLQPLVAAEMGIVPNIKYVSMQEKRH